MYMWLHLQLWTVWSVATRWTFDKSTQALIWDLDYEELRIFAARNQNHRNDLPAGNGQVATITTSRPRE
jgi:hypothetical protein